MKISSVSQIMWNFGDAKAYEPWLKKMRPQDRLVIRGGRSSLRAARNWNGSMASAASGLDASRASRKAGRRRDHSRNGAA